MMRPRAGAGVLRHPVNAACAASIAAFASSRVDCGAWPMMSSVLAGLTFGIVLPDEESTHCPLIKFLYRRTSAAGLPEVCGFSARACGDMFGTPVFTPQNSLRQFLYRVVWVKFSLCDIG